MSAMVSSVGESIATSEDGCEGVTSGAEGVVGCVERGCEDWDINTGKWGNDCVQNRVTFGGLHGNFGPSITRPRSHDT